jgi:hypothetical protein
MALQLWLLDLDRLPGLFLVAFGLGGFVVGYVVDRWWTLLVPALAIVVALIVAAIVPDDPHMLGESIPFIAIVLVCLVAIPWTSRSRSGSCSAGSSHRATADRSRSILAPRMCHAYAIECPCRIDAEQRYQSDTRPTGAPAPAARLLPRGVYTGTT